MVADIRYTMPPPLSSSSTAVESVPSEESGAQVTLEDGTTVEGDAVLVTVPLGVLKKSITLTCFIYFIHTNKVIRCN